MRHDSRAESRAVLATGGTLAIHVLLAVIGGALVTPNLPPLDPPRPRVELIDLELPTAPPPPTTEPAQPAAVPLPPPITEPRPRRAVPRVPRVQESTPTRPPETPTAPDSGGAPVTTMEDAPPAATGTFAKGPRTTGPTGRGGTGTGTGAGSGAGSADEPPTPTSVATIKTRALPKGDFSYFDASRDYPAEAKTLGIEGVIRVRLVVDLHGKVKSAVLLNKLGHGLDELALSRARTIEFTPATDTDDQPVSSVVVWTFTMTLPK